METSKTDRLASLLKQLEQRENAAAAMRSAVKAEKTKRRNGQLMAWGEALEAAYLAMTDEGQKSRIEAMILGALKGEGARVKMWRKRAAEGFARLKGVEQPAEPQKPVETPEKKPTAAVPTQKPTVTPEKKPAAETPQETVVTPEKKSVEEKPKSPVTTNERVDLNAAFNDKDKVKALGAIWDAHKEKWYVPAGKDLRPFEKWLPKKLHEYDFMAAMVG